MAGNRIYRKIEHRNQHEVILRVMAVQELAREIGVETYVEPLYYGLNTDTWWRVIRIWTTDPLPFKELLERSSKELYEYLQKANEVYLTSRKGYRNE